MGLMIWVWWKMRKVLYKCLVIFLVNRYLGSVMFPRFVGCEAHLPKWKEIARG